MALWGAPDSTAEKASGRVANGVTIFLKEAATTFHVKRRGPTF
jgi:hypothetical protein